MSTISANNNNKSKTETAIENSAISQNNSARIHSSASGNSTTEEKSLVALKWVGNGALDSKPCFYCKKYHLTIIAW